MTKELKIGKYTIETQAYYNSLKKEGITSNAKLKKLDTNNDKKLTENELAEAKIVDEEDLKKITDNEKNKGYDEDKYNEEARYQTVLNGLQNQYDDYLTQLSRVNALTSSNSNSSSGSNTASSAVSEIKTITENLKNTRNEILKLMVDKKYAEQAAKNLQQQQSSSGKYSDYSSDSIVSTGDHNFSYDFKEKMSDSQKSDLNRFKEVWKKNKKRYEAVAKKTGIPAELIAAIHWRESGCNFNTYLHNGDPLGKPTVHVPAGKLFYNWEDAAIDALKGRSKPKANDINSWYDFAERYNGLGYRNKGVPSPYVWSGTNKYYGGKYVRDFVYDPSAKDQQLGVAVMLKAIC